MALGAMVFGAAALMVPDSGWAEGPATCASRDKVVTALSEVYEENPVSIGLTDEGSVIEVMASNDGSFTIVVTHPNGITCPLAAGKAWQALQVANGDGV
ncbi:hypothetical protein V5T82_12565 [Magnetovibrio sp. PR-2]|uniref:hypothetical protein n=1 Tax=Magnetovibrio sp. PR-2 TaxID=3120356 RepID=UPI002FCDE27B